MMALPGISALPINASCLTGDCECDATADGDRPVDANPGEQKVTLNGPSKWSGVSAIGASRGVVSKKPPQGAGGMESATTRLC